LRLKVLVSVSSCSEDDDDDDDYNVSGCCWFYDINISRGSVATRWMYDGIFLFFNRNLLLNLLGKVF